MAKIIKTRNNIFPLNISDVGQVNVAMNGKKSTRLWHRSTVGTSQFRVTNKHDKQRDGVGASQY